MIKQHEYDEQIRAFSRKKGQNNLHFRGSLPSCRISMKLKGPEIGTNVKLHGYPGGTGERCRH